jgi:integrase
VRRSKDGLYRRENGILAFRFKDRDGRWREKYTGETEREAAKREKKKFLANLEQNKIPGDLAKRTVQQAVSTWLGSLEVSRNTLRSYRSCLAPVVTILADRKLENIRIEDIRSYRTARKSVGRANRTINHELLCLSYVLKEAKLWDALKGDYKPLPEGSKHSTRKPLTAEHFNSLVRTAIGNKHWAVVLDVMLLAANTTCRPCEIAGLQLGRIYLDGDYPHIAISRITTKTNAGERDIPLNRIGQLATRRLLERAHKLGANHPEHYLLPADLSKHTRQYTCSKKCTCNGRGCVKGAKNELYSRRFDGFDATIPQRGWDTAWCKLRKKAGLPRVQFYQLRHTSITAGAEENVPLAVMKSLAGHMDDRMTEYYTSVRDNPKAKAVAAIENANPELLTILGLSETSTPYRN